MDSDSIFQNDKTRVVTKVLKGLQTKWLIEKRPDLTIDDLKVSKRWGSSIRPHSREDLWKVYGKGLKKYLIEQRAPGENREAPDPKRQKLSAEVKEQRTEQKREQKSDSLRLIRIRSCCRREEKN